MAPSTVCIITSQVMEAIWETLQPIHMAIPTKSDLKKVAKDFFQRWNFPHCVGVIDCRHMRLKQPPFSESLFFNWKKFYSIKLQAVVDANYRFLFIDVGDYGRNHDSTTFFQSALYEALASGTVTLPEDDELPDSEIILPYCFIGDGAYMLMEHMMKPFIGKNLEESETNFNERLSRARMVVECAFGHLVQMWRIFLTSMQQRPEKATLITKTCCLLRNVIIDLEGRTLDSKLQEIVVPDNNVPDIIEHVQEFIVGRGNLVRNKFAKYFMYNPI